MHPFCLGSTTNRCPTGSTAAGRVSRSFSSHGVGVRIELRHSNGSLAGRGARRTISVSVLAFVVVAAVAALAWLRLVRAEPQRPAEPPRAPAPSWDEVRTRCGPTVARVTSRFRITTPALGAAWGGTAAGSGVLIRPTLVLTSSHLVQPWRQAVPYAWEGIAPRNRLGGSLESVSVHLPGQEPVPATLFAIAGAADLALLQITARPIAPLTLRGSERPLRVGEEVAVFFHHAPPGAALQALAATAVAEARPAPLAAPSFFTARVVLIERDERGRARRAALDLSDSTAGGGGAVVDRRGALVALTRARFAAAGAIRLEGHSLPTSRYAAGTVEVVSLAQIADFLSRAGVLAKPGAGTFAAP